MTGHRMQVALLTEVFADDADGERLGSRLASARRMGAELAVLPELPLNDWCPAFPEPRDEDAEAPDGPRQTRMAAAAREAGIALLGGAIVRSRGSGRRYSAAFLYDAEGSAVVSHRKLHLPDEDGFRERRHYEPGEAPPGVADPLGLPLGIQICSDIQRPQGAALLAASGAEALLVPRCTPEASYARWLLVLRAAAVTGALYVISVNRPGPEHGVPIGGPSVAIGPDGEVLLETEEPLALITLDRRVVREAREGYPGYLPMRADLYAHGWSRAAAALGAPDDASD